MMATTPGGSVFLGLRGRRRRRVPRRGRARRVRGRRVRSGSLPGTAPGRAPSPLSDPARDAACERRRQRRARDKRNAVPLHPSLLRLASSRRRRTAPSVHVDHAFANLDRSRNGARVAELVPAPTEVRDGHGWRELLLGRHPDLFFAVHRLDFTDEVEDDTRGASTSSTSSRATASRSRPRRERPPLSFAETIVVPPPGGVPAAAHPRRQLQGREGARAVSERGRIVSIDLGGSHVSAGRIDVASGRCRPSCASRCRRTQGATSSWRGSPAWPRTSSRARSTAWGSPCPARSTTPTASACSPTSSSPCTAWI